MTLSYVLLTNAALIVCMMFTAWLCSCRIRDVSIVDILWGLGFVAIAWATFLLTSGSQSSRSVWLVALTTLWGVRLAAYLAWRNHGKPEDARYRSMRERSGDRFPLTSLYLVFGLQGAIMWIVAMPLQVGQTNAAEVPMRVWNYVGILVWFVGWCFESAGDFQLARFKANSENRGKVMDRGLWRYTRHPNYFGDFLVWWGLFLVALGGITDVWTVVSPLLMSFLLLRVSGVALLDRILGQRSPEYKDYILRTSAFFPWPPRENVTSETMRSA